MVHMATYRLQYIFRLKDATDGRRVHAALYGNWRERPASGLKPGDFSIPKVGNTESTELKITSLEYSQTV
jgi:hypothetical protein